MDLKTDTAPIEVLEDLLSKRFSCRAFRPDPVPRSTIDRILAAAHTGDLQTVLALMRANAIMPVLSHTQRQDPAAYWRESYPESDGIEILSRDTMREVRQAAETITLNPHLARAFEGGISKMSVFWVEDAAEGTVYYLKPRKS